MNIFTGTVVAGMLEGIDAVVPGKHWHDLGAGDLRLSKLLMKWGATGVTAIDRYEMPPPLSEGIETIKGHFEDYHKPVENAFVSWPVNWRTDMSRLVRGAKTIIYLGKNTDSTSCADLDFWQAVRQREILFHYPHRKNVMIIYGEDTGEDRPGLPEEMAGVYQSRVWTFEEAQERWKPNGSREGETLGEAIEFLERFQRCLLSSSDFGGDERDSPEREPPL